MNNFSLDNKLMIDVYDIDILAKLPHNLTAQTPLSYIKHLDMTSSFISHSPSLPEIRRFYLFCYKSVFCKLLSRFITCAAVNLFLQFEVVFV